MQGLVHQNKDFELLLWGFPGGSNGKKSASDVGNPGLIPESGRSPGEGNSNPLQYLGLDNSMDREGLIQLFINSFGVPWWCRG